MNFTADEVRHCAKHIDPHSEKGYEGMYAEGRDMLTAYADLLERQSASVTADIVKRAAQSLGDSMSQAGSSGSDDMDWDEFKDAVRIALLAVWPVAAEPEQDHLEPDGGNLYRAHCMMIHSGRFWRCAHGKTGIDGKECAECRAGRASTQAEAVECTEEKGSLWRRAAGNLSMLMSLLRCGDKLSDDEEAAIRKIIDELCATQPHAVPHGYALDIVRDGLIRVSETNGTKRSPGPSTLIDRSRYPVSYGLLEAMLAAAPQPQGQPRAVPDEAIASFVGKAAQIISGAAFPSWQSLEKAREISDLALAMIAATPQPVDQPNATSHGWRPIETAPLDGTAVLVYPPLWNNRQCSIARYDSDKYCKKPKPFWRRDDELGQKTRSKSVPPTHWMPLPAAPQPGEPQS